MKKSFSLLLFAATLALPAAAQQDPKAGKILDQMSAKYQALNAYQASFTQTGLVTPDFQPLSRLRPVAGTFPDSSPVRILVSPRSLGGHFA